MEGGRKGQGYNKVNLLILKLKTIREIDLKGRGDIETDKACNEGNQSISSKYHLPTFHVSFQSLDTW